MFVSLFPAAVWSSVCSWSANSSNIFSVFHHQDAIVLPGARNQNLFFAGYSANWKNVLGILLVDWQGHSVIYHNKNETELLDSKIALIV